MDPSATTQLVNEHYSKLARQSVPNDEKEKQYSSRVAQSFGYTAEELSSIPEGANLGLSCGNPIALAALKEGETIVDLGSGAGFDVFLAARRVGATGLAIGVDMSLPMLSKARASASKSGTTNVQFIESNITAITLPDSTADCVISNCVINLVPQSEKHLVFKEMWRVLKPGGRVAVSDILKKRSMPASMESNLSLYVGCISGTSGVGEYEEWLKSAGFEGVVIVDKGVDLNIYKDGVVLDVDGKGKEASGGCCAPKEVETSCCGTANEGNGEGKEDKKYLGLDIDFNEWVGSYSIYAVKGT